MPDVYNKDSLLDFDENDPEQHELLHDAFDIKAAGNHLSQAVAGRSVHAPYPTIGGFTKIISNDEKQPLIDELQKIRPRVISLIELFAKRPRSLVNPSHYAAIVGNPFTYFDGEFIDSKGNKVPESEYRSHLEHVVIPYSQASGYKFDGETYRVGALARVNLSKDTMHPNTKRDAAKALALFPSHDAFDNNLAQALEILHSIDESIDILESTTFVDEKPIPWKATDTVGVGILEAPRGTLYHKMEITAAGVVKEGEVIVPTGQNQIMIEKDVQKYVQEHLDEDKETLARRIEEIIRAYDPCMSCASHFLEVNWKEI
jgi:coenzyme F420-reducing hydrogenase alpha subunit